VDASDVQRSPPYRERNALTRCGGKGELSVNDGYDVVVTEHEFDDEGWDDAEDLEDEDLDVELDEEDIQPEEDDEDF
jgi:hypothetical protein